MHALEHTFDRVASILQLVFRRIAFARIGDEVCELGGVGWRERRGSLAVVRPRRSVDAFAIATEVHAVEIQLDYLVLAEVRGEIHAETRFREFAGPAVIEWHTIVAQCAGKLHRDRAGATTRTFARLEIAECGSDGTDGIHAAMIPRIETVIFDRGKRDRDVLRQR